MHSIPLFLSDVAGSEVIVIVLVVLLFFGSKSVPGIAKTLGQALYQVRNASNELQQEIRKSGQEMKADLNIESILKETEETLVAPLDQMTTDIDNNIHYGSMPKQFKQQVTAGNPIEELNDLENSPLTETISEEMISDDTSSNGTSSDQIENEVNPTNA
jgi:sec-independent protein translocase protein TatA